MKTLQKFVPEFLIMLGMVVIFLTGVATGLALGEKTRVVAPVQAAVELTATQNHPSPTLPIQRMEREMPVSMPAVVETRQARIITWMYHLDEYGHAIWRQVGEIPAGALVKQGACWEDGYSQVEYRDPERTNWWRVEYIPCH